jgi:hypothetical protein
VSKATSTLTHPAETGNRQALVAAVVAHLERRPYRWTAEDLADLDSAGWAIITADMGRTRPLSAATVAAVVAQVAAVEQAAAEVIDDVFEGL